MIHQSNQPESNYKSPINGIAVLADLVQYQLTVPVVQPSSSKKFNCLNTKYYSKSQKYPTNFWAYLSWYGCMGSSHCLPCLASESYTLHY